MNGHGKRWKSLLRGFVLAILVGAQIATALAIATRKPETTQFGQVDFNTYYAAAILFSRGQDMYDGALTQEVAAAHGLAYIENSNYIYPPYLAALLSLTGSLEPLTLGFLWYLTSLASLSLALWLILRGQSYNAQDALRRWQYCLAFALVFAPVGHSFYVGQVNAFLLLLLAASFYALVRNQNVCGGLLLGVATLIKVAPGILFVSLLANRRCTASWSMFLTVVSIPLLTLPIFEDHLLAYLLTVPERLSTPMAHPANQSLNGFFSRTFTEGPFTVPIHAGDPLLVRALVLFTGLAIFGLVVLRLGKRREHLTRQNLDLSFGLFITLIVILSPFAWENLFLILLFPYLALFRKWPSLGLGNQAALVTSILLIQGQRLWDPFTNGPLDFPLLRYFSPLMSLGLYGAFLVVYLLMRAIPLDATGTMATVPRRRPGESEGKDD